MVREVIDGSAGLAEDDSNMPEDPERWQVYHDRVEQAAKRASHRSD
jgi:hypothetical protein